MKHLILSLIAFSSLVATAHSVEPKPDYVIVVSELTNSDEGWRQVVNALVQQHRAQVVTYEKHPAEVLEKLKGFFPKYTCLVAQPEEATREFVAEVHQLTRKLDDDPYTDTRWGILTGHSAQAALPHAQPVPSLVIHRVASGTELALECIEEGLCYDELVQHRLLEKKSGKDAAEVRGPGDTTAALVQSLNDYEADLFVTSGHATERNWQIGFRYRNGYFKSEDGKLFGLDTENVRHDIDSQNPKVYMAVGNCLMGHIDSKDAMALAWMKSAGVRQMIGYTVLTWYGYGGWGCLDYFVEQPGRYSLSEGFLANHHALVHRLQRDDLSKGDRQGLEYDRDVVAFYGDPAWDARMAPGLQRFEQTLTESDGVYTLSIKPLQGASSFDTVSNNGSQRGGRPFVQFLNHRIGAATVVEGGDLNPVITDDFILVPRPEKCDPSRTYKVVFRASSL
ncbi:MAG: hypothetical protein R3C18_01395 [Planctomycetaceae bacterium]